MATVVETICGDGTADIDPMIIYKAEKMVFEWFKNVKYVPENFLFGRSPNGWTDTKMTMQYLTRNFGPESATAIKAGHAYRMLIFDGHSSHVNPQFFHYCLNNRIIPLCLPPHTTHRLQPLDVCIFSPYKTHYSQILQSCYSSRLRGVGKSNFYLLVHAARAKAFSSANIRSGFWHTGLIPIDRSIVIRKIPSPRQIATTSSSNDLQSTTTVSEFTPKTPPLRPIDSYEAEEIFSISTPHKRRALYNISHTLLNGLLENDPSTWRRRHIAEKIVRAGEWAFIQSDQKEERIMELLQEIRQLKEKEPQHRTKIPIEGLVVTSREEIEDFWKKKQEKDKAQKEAKLQKVKAKSERLTKSLVEIQEKKRKAESMERENRLPKRWKSSAEHSKSEEKIREDLRNVERDIACAEIGVVDEEVESETEPGPVELSLNSNIEE